MTINSRNSLKSPKLKSRSSKTVERSIPKPLPKSDISLKIERDPYEFMFLTDRVSVFMKALSLHQEKEKETQGR